MEVCVSLVTIVMNDNCDTGHALIIIMCSGEFRHNTVILYFKDILLYLDQEFI